MSPQPYSLPVAIPPTTYEPEGDVVTQPKPPPEVMPIWGDDTVWCDDHKAWHHRLNHTVCPPRCDHSDFSNLAPTCALAAASGAS